MSFEPGTAAQEFGLAVFETDGAGVISRFGASCAGAPRLGNVLAVEPVTLPSNTFGNSQSDRLLGNVHHRIQHLYDYPLPAPPVFGAYFASAIAFRHDDVVQPSGQRFWVELEIDLGTVQVTPAQMSTTFAANRAGIVNNVLRRKRVVLPARQAPNANPNDWTVLIPLDQVFHRVFDPRPQTNAPPWQKLLVEVRKYDSSIGAQPVPYALDAVNGPGLPVSTLWAPNPGAASGTLMPGQGTVIALASSLGTAPAADLTGVGTPAPGQSYVLNLTQAPPSTSTVLTFGLSDRQLGGIPLPVSLEPFGADTCFLWTSFDAVANQPTTPLGTATVTVPVPPVAGLVGGRLFHQMLIADPDANALAVTATNGVAVVIGR